MDLNLTVRQIAKQLNVHYQSIINWKKGKVKHKKNYLRKMMKFLS